MGPIYQGYAQQKKYWPASNTLEKIEKEIKLSIHKPILILEKVMYTKRDNHLLINKEEEQEENQKTVFVPQTNGLALPETQSYFCTAEQCSLNNPYAPAQGYTRPDSLHFKTTPINSEIYEQVFKVSEETVKTETQFANRAPRHLEKEENRSGDWSGFIPDELYQMMMEAAKQGIFVSFLLTLTDEIINDYLKNHHYSQQQINWISQGIRALTLIAIGTSPGIALGLPISTLLLTEQLGFDKTNVNYLTTSSVVAWGLLSSPFNLLNTSLVMASSIGASVLTSKITQSSYQFVRNRFFSSKPEKEELEQENILQKTI
ncbi:TPA: Dot/Icm T4SS effector RavP [Legionella pneumophila]|nr:Dot/Icm T4SS effector RavP [Legionella pneumophila]